ncbi:hypothetical protein AgCh_001079 [Apium graveolens]
MVVGCFQISEVIRQNDIRLITSLVECWRSVTNSFHYIFGKMTIILEDVYMILGLPITGCDVTHMELEHPRPYWETNWEYLRITKEQRGEIYGREYRQVGIPVKHAFISGKSKGIGVTDKKIGITDKEFDSTGNIPKTFDDLLMRNYGESSGTKDAQGNVILEHSPVKAKSWSQVVNGSPIKQKIRFAYVPLPEGSTVVTPPNNVLKKGNDKFTTTIVEKFTKGTVSYTKVRFEQVPYCYWTEEGLSALASTIGPPLDADELTYKLEVLPFTKICVEYTIDNDLPNTLDVTVLDPVSNEKSITTVLVNYPNKPLICMICKSLGHLIGVCPNVTRKWVRKEKQVNVEIDSTIKQPSNVEKNDPNTVHNRGADENEEPTNGPMGAEDKGVDENESREGLTTVGESGNDVEGWHTVGKKKGACTLQAHVANPVTSKVGSYYSSPLTNDSPSPAITFKKLNIMDEIDKK